MKEKHSVIMALKHYRELEAFVARAVDQMYFYLDEGFKITSHVYSIEQARADTTTILNHMDVMLGVYKDLCMEEGNERPYLIIMRKYVDPIAKGKSCTNEALAEEFGVSVDTIERDIKRSFCRIRILFFGYHGIPS